MEFSAYGSPFKIEYGYTVKEALEIVYARTGKKGHFRRVHDGVDLRMTYVFLETEVYQFIEEKALPSPNFPTKDLLETPRLLRCAWLLCVEDQSTKYLVPVGSSFAVSCATNRKIITAFHNIAHEEPNDRIVDLREPYYVVQRLYPKQMVDEDWTSSD